MKPALPLLPVLALLLLACADVAPTAPAAELAHGLDHAALRVGAVTRNLYVGADLDAVLTALLTPDPDDDFPALITAVNTFTATSFGARARAIASEIERAAPMVVGLQEVSRLEVDLTALGLAYLFTVDFEDSLYAALTEQGLEYVKVAENTNIDLDVLPGPPVLALRDKDVMLVRAGTTVEAAGNKSFDICLHPVPGSCPITVPYPVPIFRGYVWARLPVGGASWTFVSTHPESGSSEDIAAIRAVQIAELVTTLAAIPGPVLVMGDFNDRPAEDGWPTPDAYALMTGVGGFTDLWPVMHPGASGLTCCHAPDLSNKVAAFYERIDFFFLRDGPSRPYGSLRLLGTTPASRVDGTDYLIWPSDHAGLAVDLLLPSGRSTGW